MAYDVRKELRDLNSSIEDVLIKRARRNIIHFARFIFPKYKAEWFHFLIAERLERAFSGEEPRQMIFIHPRAGKSLLCSQIGPAWFMGKHPGKKMIGATYGLTLSEEMGREARKYVMDEDYAKVFPDAQLSVDVTRKTDWRVKHKGGLESQYFGTSVSGVITGKGAHVLLIDDPVKSREKVMSETERNRAWNWYITDAKSRLEEQDSAVIVIQTRWHEDDLSGRMIEHDGEDVWQILHLPAISEKKEVYKLYNEDYIKELGTDTIVREPGKPLYPKKYPLQRYFEIQRDDPIFFDALYQQNPCVETGVVFRRDSLHVVNEDDVPEPVLTLQSWDTSQTVNSGSDYSARASFSYDGFTLYLTHIFKQKMMYPDLKEAALDAYDEERPDFVLVELKSNGVELVNDLSQTFMPVEGVHVNNENKKIRALSISSAVANGRVRIVQGPWTASFITSLVKFPNATHDDDVDAFVQGVRWLLNKMSRSYFRRALSRENKCYPFRPPKEWPVIRSVYIPADGGPFCVHWMTTVQTHDMYNLQWRPGTNLVFCEFYGQDPDWMGTRDGVDFSATSLVRQIFEIEKAWGIVPDITYANPALWNTTHTAKGLANALFEEGMPIIRGVHSESVGLPLLASLLSEKKLIISDTCKHVWRTIPFLEKDENRTYVLSKGQEIGPVHSLMLVATATMQGGVKSEKEEGMSEQERRDLARYKSIFDA